MRIAILYILKSFWSGNVLSARRFPTFSSRILYLTWIEWYGFYSIVIPVYVFLLVPIVAALRRDTISFMGTGRLLGQGHYR
jgi:hypothetical protein